MTTNNSNSIPARVSIIQAPLDSNKQPQPYWVQVTNNGNTEFPTPQSIGGGSQDFLLDLANLYQVGGEGNQYIFLNGSPSPVNNMPFPEPVTRMSWGGSSMYLLGSSNNLYSYNPSSPDNAPMDISLDMTIGQVWSMKNLGEQLVILYDMGMVSVYDPAMEQWSHCEVVEMTGAKALGTIGTWSDSPIFIADSDTLSTLTLLEGGYDLQTVISLEGEWEGVCDISGLRVAYANTGASSTYLYFNTNSDGSIYCIFLNPDDYNNSEYRMLGAGGQTKSVSWGPGKIFANKDGFLYYVDPEGYQNIVFYNPLQDPVYLHPNAANGETVLPNDSFVLTNNQGQNSSALEFTPAAGGSPVFTWIWYEENTGPDGPDKSFYQTSTPNGEGVQINLQAEGVGHPDSLEIQTEVSDDGEGNLDIASTDIVTVGVIDIDPVLPGGGIA